MAKALLLVHGAEGSTVLTNEKESSTHMITFMFKLTKGETMPKAASERKISANQYQPEAVGRADAGEHGAKPIARQLGRADQQLLCLLCCIT